MVVVGEKDERDNEGFKLKPKT